MREGIGVLGSSALALCAAGAAIAARAAAGRSLYPIQFRGVLQPWGAPHLRGPVCAERGAGAQLPVVVGAD